MILKSWKSCVDIALSVPVVSDMKLPPGVPFPLIGVPNVNVLC